MVHLVEMRAAGVSVKESGGPVKPGGSLAGTMDSWSQ
jgi:hypothetical protein